MQESIYDAFIGKFLERAKGIVQSNPLDTATMIGAHASREQFDKIIGFMEVARNENAEFLIGGKQATVGSDLSGGFYVEPTLLKGDNSMRIF